MIQHTENDRVKAEGLRYFIDRRIGKPTAKHEFEASMKEVKRVDEDILEAEFEEWEREEE